MNRILSLVQEVIGMNIRDSYKIMAIRMITTYEQQADGVATLARRLNEADEEEKDLIESGFLALIEQELIWEEQLDDEATATNAHEALADSERIFILQTQTM